MHFPTHLFIHLTNILNVCDFRNREDRNEQDSYRPCPLATHSLMWETDVNKGQSENVENVAKDQ